MGRFRGSANARRRLVGEDSSVADVDDTMRIFGDVGLVGDEDNGVAAGVECIEKRHDLDRKSVV